MLSLLIDLGIALVGVLLLVVVVWIWNWRRNRAEERFLRERSPEATLPPHPRHDDTDRWNLTP
jgi:hypothetical protein